MSRSAPAGLCVWPRTRPLHAVIRRAADKEAFAAALGRRLLTIA